MVTSSSASGATGIGGSGAIGGAVAIGSDVPTAGESGCSCVLGPTPASRSAGALLALLGGLGLVVRKRSERERT
ncbi:MAG: MYXO-CTERM sorting domain-containing protein [Polyangiaceae bacterium]